MATPTTLLDESTLARSQAGDAAGLHLLVMGPKLFATFALPARGEVIVGRGGGEAADIRLDDPKASRRHLRLHVGDEVEVEDLGSANGTRVHDRKLQPGARVRVLPGEAIAVGALVLMVQPNRAPRTASRGRLLSHEEFEGRVEWECARAEATGETFSVARVQAPADAPAPPVHPLRPIDVVGRYGPGEYELLLPGLAGETARALATAFAARFNGAGRSPRIGVAGYPDDGRHAAALLARAGARARGPEDARGNGDRAGGEAIGAIACAEESMQRVQALAERAAAGDINVLILGETGVGKEVLARSIHAASARASRPMASINCAALSLSLLESELFGHERGAFTGAGQAKPGLLETAPGGTVFLDEVGELAPALQAKLLRVIETREVLRVGGVRARKIDVRFVSATNRDLEAEVARGGFRRDLYFRLNGMTLTIPPLRERPRDLPILARAFVTSLARGRTPEISEPAMAVLRAHGWPGNVRELRNVIERALLLCDGRALLPEHLPPPVPVVADSAEPALPAAPPAARGTDGDERTRILAALAACGGNQSRAARQLGISRKVLIARLDSYGVARPRKPGQTARGEVSDHPSNGANGKPPGNARTPITAIDPVAAAPSATPAPRAAAAERYVLDREIGQGGMGRVFAGRDLRLGRTVAIKMLRTQDAALATRFEREVRLAARLQHPGVVPVYDAGFWPSGEPFLVMKLVLGQSLARVIRDADTPADRLALLPQVIAAAEAVAYAHDQGIVHRDLKPSNILVGAFGETVVVDWGLAKDLKARAAESDSVPPLPSSGEGRGEGPPAGDTAAGAVVGTPSFMSPEQAAGRPVDPRADVYALGAILYHVLAGTAPQPTAPLASLEPRLAPDLLAIVDKAMAADPARRYPSAFELADDLKRFAGGQLVVARSYTPLARAGRFAARHPIAVGVAAAVAASLTVLAALSFR